MSLRNFLWFCVKPPYFGTCLFNLAAVAVLAAINFDGYNFWDTSAQDLTGWSNTTCNFGGNGTNSTNDVYHFYQPDYMAIFPLISLVLNVSIYITLALTFAFTLWMLMCHVGAALKQWPFLFRNGRAYRITITMLLYFCVSSVVACTVLTMRTCLAPREDINPGQFNLYLMTIPLIPLVLNGCLYAVSMGYLKRQEKRLSRPSRSGDRV